MRKTVKRYKPKHQIVKRLPKSVQKDFAEILDSAIDHIGKVIDNAKPTDIIDLASQVGLLYMAQAPSKSMEYKLYHISITALAYKQLTKENSSEAQSLASAGWILGETTNYLIWVALQLAATKTPEVLAGIAEYSGITQDEAEFIASMQQKFQGQGKVTDADLARLNKLREDAQRFIDSVEKKEEDQQMAGSAR